MVLLAKYQSNGFKVTMPVPFEFQNEPKQKTENRKIQQQSKSKRENIQHPKTQPHEAEGIETKSNNYLDLSWNPE